MKDRLRVLHLSASDHGGAYLFAENLVKNLGSAHFDLKHLVYTGERQNISLTGIKVLDKWIKFGLHAFEKAVFLLYEKDKSLRFKFSLGFPGIPLFLLKRLCSGYDIIHLHWINKGFINIRHLGKLGKPIVWTCHDIWPVTGGCHLTFGCNHYQTGCGHCPYLKNPSRNDLSSKLLSKKEKIYQHLNLTLVSPSQWMLANTQAAMLGKGHTHVLINNGVDTRIFNFQGKSHTQSKFRIGFVAANLNDENKALHRLAGAISLLENKEDYQLVLIGRKKQDFSFPIDIDYEIFEDINTSEKMAEQYNHMDLLAVTSTLETFPTTLLEASCCGVFCTGFDIGGIREITDATGGKVLKPFDIAQLAQTIQEVKTGGYDKTALSAKASARFGLDKTAETYGALYRQLATIKH
jgi:glycosyltransferase involved in cell wall biosynthesis